MTRKTTNIEIGIHDDMISLTMSFDDDAKEHILFRPDLARQISEQLAKATETLEWTKRQLNGVPGDGIGISDGSNLSITGG